MDQPQRLLPLENLHLVAVDFEIDGQRSRNICFVFDNQDSWHGSIKLNVLPRPGSLSTITLPPCAFTM